MLDWEEQTSEELEGDPPYTVDVTLDAGLWSASGPEGFYFSQEFEDAGYLPMEFWTGAVFSYAWKPGWPSTGIPGGGTATVRLDALYAGSAGPIAGDGMTSVIGSSDYLAATGYGALLGDPYYGLYLDFYISPTTGPGYNANLSEGIAWARITGSYTETPLAPYRTIWQRSEYEFFPASDLADTARDLSAWGAPEVGAATAFPRGQWLRGVQKFWVAIAAQYELTHYYYGGPGETGYDVNKFTIATHGADMAQAQISSAMDLNRARFVRARK